MIDIHTIRENPEIVQNALKNRGYPEDSFKVLEEIIEFDVKWRNVKKKEEELRAERNTLSLAINEKKKTGESADEEIKKSTALSKRIKEIRIETEQLEARRNDLLLQLPAIPHKSVPVGEGERKNVEIRRWGKPEKNAGDVLSHDQIGEISGLIDCERGVKLAEHRFAILKGPIAKLERVLINFMLSVHTTHGYTEVVPPYLVNTKTMTGTGQLPKFADELYKCKDDDLWMIPTAEVPLTNIFANEILDEAQLPVKITAFTPCFRREAGAYGKDIKGLIRQHQFDKVELVKFTYPERSYAELESLTQDAERILQLLELPYRVVELCTGDLGFASSKTYDIEVWLPSQDKYREISSCSNCVDFQARRANIKFRRGGKLEYVHTLNGSGIAVGRTLIAILENFQKDKKTVKIPKVLRDFMGMEEISFSLFSRKLSLHLFGCGYHKRVVGFIYALDILRDVQESTVILIHLRQLVYVCFKTGVLHLLRSFRNPFEGLKEIMFGSSPRQFFCEHRKKCHYRFVCSSFLFRKFAVDYVVVVKFYVEKIQE